MSVLRRALAAWAARPALVVAAMVPVVVSMLVSILFVGPLADLAPEDSPLHAAREGLAFLAIETLDDFTLEPLAFLLAIWPVFAARSPELPSWFALRRWPATFVLYGLVAVLTNLGCQLILPGVLIGWMGAYVAIAAADSLDLDFPRRALAPLARSPLQTAGVLCIAVVGAAASMWLDVVVGGPEALLAARPTTRPLLGWLGELAFYQLPWAFSSACLAVLYLDATHPDAEATGAGPVAEAARVRDNPWHAD